MAAPPYISLDYTPYLISEGMTAEFVVRFNAYQSYQSDTFLPQLNAMGAYCQTEATRAETNAIRAEAAANQAATAAGQNFPSFTSADYKKLWGVNLAGDGVDLFDLGQMLQELPALPAPVLTPDAVNGPDFTLPTEAGQTGDYLRLGTAGLEYSPQTERMVEIDRHELTGQSFVKFDNIMSDDFHHYHVALRGVCPSSFAVLYATMLGSDGLFLSGQYYSSISYAYFSTSETRTGGLYDQIHLTANQTDANSSGLSGSIDFYRKNSTQRVTMLSSLINPASGAANTWLMSEDARAQNKTIGDVRGIQFSLSAGNFASGEIVIYRVA